MEACVLTTDTWQILFRAVRTSQLAPGEIDPAKMSFLFRLMWIENGFWPSPSTQTGQAGLPHPAFQFMVLMDWPGTRLKVLEESHQPRRLAAPLIPLRGL